MGSRRDAGVLSIADLVETSMERAIQSGNPTMAGASRLREATYG